MSQPQRLAIHRDRPPPLVRTGAVGQHAPTAPAIASGSTRPGPPAGHPAPTPRSRSSKQRSQATRERALQAIRDLAADGGPVTFEAVAARGKVSRSWLYSQADLRLEIGRLRALSARAPASPPVPTRQRASDASLRQRLEAVTAEVKRLRAENRQLRGQLARQFGTDRAARLPGRWPTRDR